MNPIDPKLSTIGNKVLDIAKIPNDQKFGDVIAILMIISIILTTIRVLQECHASETKQFGELQKTQFYGEQIKIYSRRSSWFTKRRIQKIIRSKMCKEDYYQYGLPITQAILAVGENVTEDDVLTLMEQTNV